MDVTYLHIKRAIESNKEETARDWGIIKTITEVEKKNLRRLNSGLAEYLRRQSYEFSYEDREAAEDVVLRGVEKIAGRRGAKLRNLPER